MELSERALRAIDRLRLRKQHYQHTFNTPVGNEVLIDLARFCRANETCFHADARLHAVAEGRREVFLRIQQHLQLSSEQLFALYQGNLALKPGDKND